MNRVTTEDIQAKIVNEQYAVWPGTTTTICKLFLENGFSVTGESACVDPANFDEELGRELAYKQAFAKIWPLEGYLLAEELYEERLWAESDARLNVNMDEMGGFEAFKRGLLDLTPEERAMWDKPAQQEATFQRREGDADIENIVAEIERVFGKGSVKVITL